MKNQVSRQKKFHIPKMPRYYLARHRLLQLLNQSTDGKLTFVSAPAGYGKTSLVIDFARRTDLPVCWCSLESDDNKLYVFVEGLVNSIQARFPDFGISTIASLNLNASQRLDAHVIAAIIIKDMQDHIDEHFVLVLDDFHLVDTNGEINSLVNDLLVDSDESFHLVIISRSLLSLVDLPLLVAQSQVGGLSYSELAFTRHEIRDLFLLIKKQSLSETDVQSLFSEGEGWITGLFLHMQVSSEKIVPVDASSNQSQDEIFDYLAEEVFSAQTEEVQGFLIRSSLFDQFDIQMLQEVLTSAGINELTLKASLEKVLHLNLFITQVGYEGNSYKYHPLFEAFLKEKAQVLIADEVRNIQLALAEYYFRHQEWGKAFNYFNQSGHAEKIENLVMAAAPELISKGQISDLAEWLATIPSEAIQRHPGLLSTWGAIYCVQGDLAAGIDHLTRANKLILNDKDLLSLTLTRRAGALRLMGNYEDALKDANEVLRITRGEPGLAKFTADAHMIKGLCLSFQGDLTSALVEFDTAQSLYTVKNDEDSEAKAIYQIGLIQKNSGNFEKALTLLKECASHYQATGNIIWETSVLNSLGILNHVSCNFREAINDFQKAMDFAKATKNKRTESYILASVGDLYQDIGATEEAMEAYNQSRLIASETGDQYLMLYDDFSLFRIGRNYSTGNSRFTQLKQEINQSKNKSLVVELKMLESMVYFQSEEYEKGAANIQNALTIFQHNKLYIEYIKGLAFAFYCITQFPALVGKLNLLEAYQSILEKSGSRSIFLLKIHQFGISLKEMENVLPVEYIHRWVKGDWKALESSISQIKNQIRLGNTIVPLKPAKVNIRTFGRINISKKGRSIPLSEWKSNTARDLFLFLVIHRRPYEKEELGEIFWPDSTAGELKIRFKNAIYRLRKAVGKELILFENDHYSIDRSVDLESDYDDFQNELLPRDSQEEPEEKIKRLERIIKIYRGPFLKKIDLPWANSIRVETEQAYQRTLVSLAELMVQTGRFEEALKHGSQAMEIDYLNEKAYQVVMQAYGGLHDRSMVIKTFQKLKAVLKRELGVETSHESQQLFELLTY